MNIDSVFQLSYPSSLPKDQDSTLTDLHHEEAIELDELDLHASPTVGASYHDL
jgi:hypothetical protein